MPQQQATTGPAPMEGVERTNVVIICSQQRAGDVQKNSYAIDVNRREGRNCYNCGGFRHMARHYRNRRVGNRVGKRRRLEYRENEEQRRIEEGKKKQNLNREQDLIFLN